MQKMYRYWYSKRKMLPENAKFFQNVYIEYPKCTKRVPKYFYFIDKEILRKAKNAS